MVIPLTVLILERGKVFVAFHGETLAGDLVQDL